MSVGPNGYFGTPTRHCKHPIVFYRVLQFAALETPFPAKSGTTQMRQGMFWRPSAFSARHLMNSLTREGPPVQELVARWLQHMPAVTIPPEETFSRAICMSCPEPHALLICHGVWSSYSFPCPEKRYARASLGIPFVSGLANLENLVDARVRGPDLDMRGREVIDADFAMNQLKFAQRMHAFLLQQAHLLPRTMLAEVQAQVDLWHGKLFHCLDCELQDSAPFRNTSRLLHALLLGGFFRNRSVLKEAVITAVPLVVGSDESAVDHFKRKLSKPGALPSKSTLYREQFALVAAWCKMTQDERKKVAVAGGSSNFVRWASVDASPQGVADWVLHGYRELHVSDVIPTFTEAMELIHLIHSNGLHWASQGSGLNDNEVEELPPRVSEIMASLQKKLQWRFELACSSRQR